MSVSAGTADKLRQAWYGSLSMAVIAANAGLACWQEVRGFWVSEQRAGRLPRGARPVAGTRTSDWIPSPGAVARPKARRASTIAAVDRALVAEFVAECVESVDGAKVSASAMFSAYLAWSAARASAALAQQAFGRVMTGARRRQADGLWYLDVRLAADLAPDAAGALDEDDGDDLDDRFVPRVSDGDPLLRRLRARHGRQHGDGFHQVPEAALRFDARGARLPTPAELIAMQRAADARAPKGPTS